MGSSRFLKAVRARHREGALVVKVFIKPDPSVSLKQFAKRIKGGPTRSHVGIHTRLRADDAHPAQPSGRLSSIAQTSCRTLAPSKPNVLVIYSDNGSRAISTIASAPGPS